MPKNPVDRSTRLALFAVGMLLVGACADDEGAADNAVADMVSHAADSGDIPDSVEDVVPQPTCAELASNEAFLAVGNGPSTQIHPEVAFDGEALWITYSAPDAGSGFDVYATRVGCDGAVLVPPVQMNQLVDANEGDSSIAVNGDRIFVVWNSDSSSGTHNLDTYTHVLNPDGTTLWDSERAFEGTLDGVPNPGNVWMPALVADNDGFVLAGSWGTENVGGFQAYAQRVDRDGGPVGDATEIARTEGVSQLEPAVAVGSGGDWVLAWAESSVDGPDQTKFRSFAADGTVGDVHVVTEGSRVAAAAAPDGSFLIAGSSDSSPNSQIVIVNEAGNQLAEIDAGGLDHTPALAVSPEGAAVVVFFQVVQGFRSRLFAAGLDNPDAPFRLDANDLVAPYETSVVSVGDDHFATVWADGSNPEFEVMVRIFTASE